MEEKRLLNTREVAEFLDINEKMVYGLVAEKGLPATKVTGKWLFQRHLVERWFEGRTVNYPKETECAPAPESLLVVAGSNDILLDRALALFHRVNPGHVAVFGNLGSLGGIQALRRNLCQIASCHLLQEDGQEYNFDFAGELLGQLPGVVNLALREQGILLSRGNPHNIRCVADLGQKGIRIVNRPAGTGTRLLLDRELDRAGLRPEQVSGYDREMGRHLDVGLEVLAGRADAAAAIRAVAGLLELDFLPLRWERFDLLIRREQFFERSVQRFLGLFHEPEFKALADGLQGYDMSLSGKMVFPQEEVG